MMKKYIVKYGLFVFTAIAVVSFCVGIGISGKAYAWNTSEWRPSIEINKDITATTENIKQAKISYEESINFVRDYEDDGHVFEDKVNELQNTISEMEKFIQEERPELEEVTKNSYAAFFAKGLLDEIVGSKIFTDGLFHWGLVTFIACGEDQEIVKFIEDYYNTKNELNNAINDMNNASTKYQQSTEIVVNYPTYIQNLNVHLEHINAILPEIYEIESVYGAAGESRIEGDNIFCHPCPEGSITSYFGEWRGGYGHQGTDFACSTGSPIYAAADGCVVDTGSSPTMGNYIKIDHGNGLVTIYMHCSHIYVPNGMQVFKGDNIALVGSTGDSTGPHLHFQVELNGSPVNGLNYL